MNIKELGEKITELANKHNWDSRLLTGDDDGEMGLFEIASVEWDHDFQAIVINSGERVEE